MKIKKYLFAAAVLFLAGSILTYCGKPAQTTKKEERGEKREEGAGTVEKNAEREADGGEGSDRRRGEVSTERDKELDSSEKSGPLDEELVEGETRVGQISKDSELLKGPLADGKVGDWKIYNSRVAFVISGVGNSRNWSGATGQIIDASAKGEGGRWSADMLGECFSFIGLVRIFRAKKFEVVSPGGLGKDAVLKVIVEDYGIPILDSVLKTKILKGKLEIIYRLKPRSLFLEVTTRWEGGNRWRKMPMGDGLIFGDGRVKLFTPEYGLNRDKLSRGKLSWIGGFSSESSYILKSPNSPLWIPLSRATILPITGKIAGTSEKISTYSRLFGVSAAGLEPLLRELSGQKNPKVIKIKLEGLKEYRDFSALLKTSGGSYLSESSTTNDGRIEFYVGSNTGGPFEVQIWTPWGEIVKWPIPAGGGIHKIPLKAPGYLKISVREKGPDGKVKGWIPARIRALSLTGGPSYLFDVAAPTEKFALKSGKYELLISRGLAYEYRKETVEIRPGGEKELAVVLKKSVALDGYIAGDMHLHSQPSIDSELAVEERIKALVAEGLDFAVATEHDRWFDYSPYVKKLGLEKFLKTAIGQEISPLNYHINAYPLKAVPTGENAYFGIGWGIYKNGEYQRTLLAPELWKILRQKYKVPIIQINHPRRGLFKSIGYDPKAGVKALAPGLFDTNWDVVELYNGKDRDEFLKEVLWDWFSLLNQGIIKTGVGNSDSHSQGSRPGLPRTLIAVRAQTADQIDLTEVVNSLKSLRAQVYAGPFIKIERGGKLLLPGTTVAAKSVDLEVSIYAPSWIPVDYVKIYANGKLLQKYSVSPSQNGSALRWRKNIRISPSADTWVVVLAGSENKTMAPVYPDRKPVSLHNPIFIDVDGDGFKVAPAP